MKNVLFAILLFIASVSAQDNEKVDLVKRLFEVTNAKANYEREIMTLLVELYPHNDVELFSKLYWNYLNWDSVSADVIKVYSEVFSEGELKYLIEFNSNETGQKIIKKLSNLFSDLRELYRNRLEKNRGVVDSLAKEAFLIYLRDTTITTPIDIDKKYFNTDISIDTNVTINKNSTCSGFKTGKFVDILVPDGKAVIIRDDSLQYEIIDEINYKAVYKITWVNDCEYNLEFISNNNKKLAFFTVGDIINVKIYAINGDTCTGIVNSQKGGKSQFSLKKVQ